MRRLIAFDCAGDTLGATLEGADGRIGLLLVTGGSQTRIGSHRMYERLSKILVEDDLSCLRFDRRGVGDSEGEDPGFRGSAADLAAAAAALRRECTGLERVYGFGLCDGATALALFGAPAGLDGLILANPWLVEAEAGAPAPAAVRRHYRDRLLSLDGWRKLLSGGVDYRKLFKSILRIARPAAPASLAGDVAQALAAARLPIIWLLADRDNTAVAAAAELRAPAFRGLAERRIALATDSHTFARPGDEALLADAVREALAALDQAG